MELEAPIFTIVISTIGKEKLELLFTSLKNQTLKQFEVILVDQSDDGLLEVKYHYVSKDINIKFIRDNGRGVSRGRNIGKTNISGKYVFFPDDDCWFGNNLLLDVSHRFSNNNDLSFLSVYADDESNTGKIASLNKSPCRITENNVFKTTIEFAMFFRANVFHEGFSFNESYGVGNHTKKQADEGPELLIRLLKNNHLGYYDPSLTIRHPSPFEQKNKNMIKRGYFYNYARGSLIKELNLSKMELLYPLLKHGIATIGYFCLFDFRRSRYYLNCFLGRISGYYVSE